MKRRILCFVIIMMSMLCAKAQINVCLSEYTASSSGEFFNFSIENSFSQPVYVFYIKVADLKDNSILFYSNSNLIINSAHGPANAWGQTHNFQFSRNSPEGRNLWNTTYMVEIQYAQVYDGAQVKTEQFLTNGGIGIPLIPTAINDIKQRYEAKRYYDLNGTIVEKPIKGHIYICNGKKIIYGMANTSSMPKKVIHKIFAHF